MSGAKVVPLPQKSASAEAGDDKRTVGSHSRATLYQERIFIVDNEFSCILAGEFRLLVMYLVNCKFCEGDFFSRFRRISRDDPVLMIGSC